MPYKKPETLDEAILQTVAYSDVFDYPLRLPEIHRNLIGRPASLDAVNDVLHNGLLTDRRLQTRQGFFFLPAREKLVEVRQQRSAYADALWQQAIRYGRWIAHLPFVRMVALTGALANRNVASGADLDYLIVTKPGYLWLCRAFILLLTHLTTPFSARICPNYLLTSEVLRLEEQTLFTAQELCRMIPLSGLAIYEQFRALNSWSDNFLPNAASSAPSYDYVYEPAFKPLQIVGEWLFSLPAGKRLEQWEMTRKINKLSAQSHLNTEVHFSADHCKGHFEQHGARTMKAFTTRVSRFMKLT